MMSSERHPAKPCSWTTTLESASSSVRLSTRCALLVIRIDLWCRRTSAQSFLVSYGISTQPETGAKYFFATWYQMIPKVRDGGANNLGVLKSAWWVSHAQGILEITDRATLLRALKIKVSNWGGHSCCTFYNVHMVRLGLSSTLSMHMLTFIY